MGRYSEDADKAEGEMVQERERGTVPKGAESGSDVGSERKRVWERAEGRENGRKRERPLTVRTASVAPKLVRRLDVGESAGPGPHLGVLEDCSVPEDFGNPGKQGGSVQSRCSNPLPAVSLRC